MIDYQDDFHDLVDNLLWTAVCYADGPLRLHMKDDAVFSRFSHEISSFEALFKADPQIEELDRCFACIPEFVRKYLHQQLEKDLNFLDHEFKKEEKCPLDFALDMGKLARRDFEVGVVIALVIHLVQLVYLYGPVNRDGNTHRAEDSDEAKYAALRLVERSIGDDPRFVWRTTENEPKECYFAVRHRHPNSLSRCQNGLKGYILTEAPLCVFHGEAASSTVLNPRRDVDPGAHTGSAMIASETTRNGRCVAQHLMSEQQGLRDSRLAKAWKGLCEAYRNVPKLSLSGRLLEHVQSACGMK
ncbi:hypothetical protein F4678DRAFT_237131 [Xylaria arbuscula]|nr:hypothetical protein F4678DRAFT_237131 [Xylaria arbuscula]